MAAIVCAALLGEIYAQVLITEQVLKYIERPPSTIFALVVRHRKAAPAVITFVATTAPCVTLSPSRSGRDAHRC